MNGGNRGGRLTAQVVLSILGAAGMIGGALLAWLKPLKFTALELNWRLLTHYYRAHSVAYFAARPSRAITSIGAIMIALGVIALIGLVIRWRWLTFLAGLAGIVTVLAFGYTLVRAPQVHLLTALGIGGWIGLIGGILALIGGLIPVRRRRRAGPRMPAGQVG